MSAHRATKSRVGTPFNIHPAQHTFHHRVPASSHMRVFSPSRVGASSPDLTFSSSPLHRKCAQSISHSCTLLAVSNSASTELQSPCGEGMRVTFVTPLHSDSARPFGRIARRAAEGAATAGLRYHTKSSLSSRRHFVHLHITHKALLAHICPCTCLAKPTLSIWPRPTLLDQ